MQYTNTLSLPQPIVDAIINDPYDPGMGDISATGLLATPLQRRLRKEHEDELVEDVADNIWALLGKSVHNILEKSGNKEGQAITEQRFYARIHGIVVSGQMDRVAFEKLDNGLMRASDYKVTSAYVISTGSRIPEWEEQLNIYACLLRHNDIHVDELEVVAILRDWSKLALLRDSGGTYPKFQIHRQPIRLWTDEEQEQFIIDRINLHELGMTEVITCSDEERWAKPAKFAVMKEGRKSALRVLDSEYEAFDWCVDNKHTTVPLHNSAEPNGEELHQLKPGITLVERPATYVRCESYCNVAEFCPVLHPELNG